MKAEEFLCMAIDCKNTTIIHRYNIDTGFCDSCQKKLEKNILGMVFKD